MKYIFAFTLSAILIQCVPITTSTNSNNRPLQFNNHNYAQNVGAVSVKPIPESKESAYPTIRLGSRGVIINLDLFENNVSYLNAKLVHCNADWTQSSLIELEYMKDFNEFPSQDYSYSENTIIPYVQHRFEIPSPKISGNYLVVVYRETNQQDIIISRRLIVYDQKASIEAKVLVSSLVPKRQEYQQVEFDVNYRGINTNNPLNDLQVIILQNHNWHAHISGLQPTLIRHDQNTLEYHHFDGSNNFEGLNEFRFFDMRSIDFRGMNIRKVQKSEININAYLGLDKSRKYESYAQLIVDQNGGYLLENRDPDDSQLQSEYIFVNFELQNEKLETPIFIVGRQNEWAMNPSNKMIYDENTSSYKGQILLKQGYYDYAYWIDNEDEKSQLEGNHFQTLNDYEIIVYYRNTSNNYDEVIGYTKFSSLQN